MSTTTTTSSPSSPSFSTWFTRYCHGVYYGHGLLLTLSLLPNILDYLTAIDSALGISVNEFETITSSSDMGALCVSGYLENCFLFVIGILILSIATYVPIQDRTVPSLALGLCLLFIARQEYKIATNTWHVQIYQGKFTEFLRTLAMPLNSFFGSLHTMLSIGTILGFGQMIEKSKSE